MNEVEVEVCSIHRKEAQDTDWNSAAFADQPVQHGPRARVHQETSSPFDLPQKCATQQTTKTKRFHDRMCF